MIESACAVPQGISASQDGVAKGVCPEIELDVSFSSILGLKKKPHDLLVWLRYDAQAARLKSEERMSAISSSVADIGEGNNSVGGRHLGAR